MVNGRWRTLLSWCWPDNCALCRARCHDGDGLCDGCRAGLPWLTSACTRCAAPLAPGSNGLACGKCQQRPPPFHDSVAVLRYEPPLDRLVLDLKYHARLDRARILGELLARRLVGLSELPDAIVPVPLHSSRLRERGYNQSLEIARIIARHLDMPIAARSCQRLRPTAAQAGLPVAQRARNVRNAFAVRGNVSGKHIAIVDDVMTSGHTVGALSKALRRAGARKVSVWVVARA